MTFFAPEMHIFGEKISLDFQKALICKASRRQLQAKAHQI
jgi:hypothetical protein